MLHDVSKGQRGSCISCGLYWRFVFSQRHIVYPPAPVSQGIAEQRRKLLPYTIRPDRPLHYLRPEQPH